MAALPPVAPAVQPVVIVVCVFMTRPLAVMVAVTLIILVWLIPVVMAELHPPRR